MAKYRKRPIVIEAFQWHGEEVEGFKRVTATPNASPVDGPFDLIIHTLEGDMYANEGDWIITGVKGERYPCKPDIFAMSYEPAEQPEVAA